MLERYIAQHKQQQTSTPEPHVLQMFIHVSHVYCLCEYTVGVVLNYSVSSALNRFPPAEHSALCMLILLHDDTFSYVF